MLQYEKVSIIYKQGKRVMFLAGIRVAQKLLNRRKVPSVMKKHHSIEMS
jgi:hypothetical protein